MVISLLIGSFIIIISVLVQAYGNVLWLKKILASKNFQTSNSISRPLRLLTYSFIFFSIIHFIQTGFWAVAYMLIPEITGVFSSASEAWYFSMVTFTSLGYGDLTLTDDWRLLSGIEAINGIMLIGWSTAMMFSLIQQIYKSQNPN
ncbi:potassium channel family protein [Xanthomarina sp. F2636L]|uniref:potassium channel family protein n=1 Tax=Xanthomarina sp. F2636L TaxID=2996018 RepID=UPI00225E0C25|nr:potassium channel family protein [Xanthomarina sp. F2636L]MCX7550370.1 potassium channel family protein [Xanthomarina sp. F2636L]